MLWVYGHYKYFYPLSPGGDYRRQNLTSNVGPRAEIINFEKCSTVFVIRIQQLQQRLRYRCPPGGSPTFAPDQDFLVSTTR